MRSFVLLLAALALAPAGRTQALHEALAPFARLVGTWEGTAEALTPSGPLTLRQTEQVRPELEGHLLVVEGTGRYLDDAPEPGEIGFHAFGVFSVDAATDTVFYDAFTREGRHTRVQPVVTEDGFEWSITPEQGPVIHYVMRIDAEGRWVETGEMSFDGGATWRPFFEMTLSRVAE